MRTFNPLEARGMSHALSAGLSDKAQEVGRRRIRDRPSLTWVESVAYVSIRRSAILVKFFGTNSIDNYGRLMLGFLAMEKREGAIS